MDGRLSYLDRIEGTARATPVPMAASLGGTARSVEEWAPPEYGDYLATSNDVYTTAWLRAKMLAKLPILVWQGTRIQEPAQGNLAALLTRPNPFYTRQKLAVWTELSMAIWGRAVWLLERGEGPGAAQRRPREIWPVKPTQLRVVPHPTEYLSHYLYRTDDGNEYPFMPWEVMLVEYPNPNDAHAPLVPMAAARLAAEVASASMRANLDLFRQGMMLGGFVGPADQTQTYTPEQASELEEMMARRFTGQKQAHRWQVLRYAMSMKQMNITPRDAEFIQGINVTFRQVCRAMGVPAPLVGDAEFATLANLRVYERMFWEHTGEFEADYVAAEMTRQLVPAFPGVTRVSYDLGDVVALQEDEQIKWEREAGQIDRGVITVNEWREWNGLPALPWGDTWWAPATSLPVENVEPPQPAEGRAVPLGAGSRRDAGGRLSARDSYRDEEDRLADAVREVMRRQQDAVTRKLKQRTDDTTLERSAAAAASDPFDVIKWTDRTRAACDARYVAAAEKAMMSEARLLGMTAEELAAALQSQATRAALEAQVQQFAHRITHTTWERLRAELSGGLGKGMTTDELAGLIDWVFDGRLGDARTIAQSEVTRAVTTGQMAAFTQAGVTHKRWVSQMDGLQRDTHGAAHGQTVGVLDNFTVGAGSGPGPGQIGLAEEDVNCRCVMQPVMTEPRSGSNGEGGLPRALAALADTLGVDHG